MKNIVLTFKGSTEMQCSSQEDYDTKVAYLLETLKNSVAGFLNLEVESAEGSEDFLD